MLNKILIAISKYIKETTQDYTDLEVADAEPVRIDQRREFPFTFVLKDGTYASIISVNGVFGIPSRQEFKDREKQISKRFRSFLSSPGSSFSFFYSESRDVEGEKVRKIVSPSRVTIKQTGLSMSDILDEKELLQRSSFLEKSSYIVIYTDASFLSKNEIKQSAKTVREASKINPPPFMSDAQALVDGLKVVKDRHISTVTELYKMLNRTGVNSQILDSKSALRAVKSMLTKKNESSFNPVVPGDQVSVRLLKDSYRFKSDISEFGYPRLGEQILDKSGDAVTDTFFRYGDYVHAPLKMSFHPANPESFTQLINKAGSLGIDWSCSMTIKSSGLSQLGMKRVLAGLTAFLSKENRKMTKAVNALQEYVDAGGVDVSMQTEFDTYIRTTYDNQKDASLLSSNVSKFQRTIEGWGVCQVKDSVGDDCAESYFSQIPMLCKNSIAEPTAMPFPVAQTMLPLTHAANPWKAGSLIFNRENGVLFPYEIASRLQTTWNNIVIGGPGSGKSTFINAYNEALVLKGGLNSLPYILIMDVGESSVGFIQMVKDSLQPSEKHYSQQFRLRNSKKTRINPFDLQLGCSKPLPIEFSFITNLITFLATPLGEEKPHEEIPGLVSLCVTKAFEKAATTEKKLFEYNIVPEIDKALGGLNYSCDEFATWMEIRDFLFENGESHLASLAQRHQVPTLNDVAAQTTDESIVKEYENVSTGRGDNILAYFQRKLKDASREYPALSGTTTFDTGEAKIMAIELGDVAKGDSPADKKRTAVFFQLGRFLGRSFTLDAKEDLDDFNCSEMYLKYHSKRLRLISQSLKHIVYDEFHRTALAKAEYDDKGNLKERGDATIKMVETDKRECRKRGTIVTLASQLHTDYTRAIIELSTGIYILKNPGGDSTKQVCRLFGFNENAEEVLREKVNGPTEKGSSILVKFKLKTREVVEHLNLKVGTTSLWAYVTGQNDRELKEYVFNEMSAEIGRKILVKRFPEATCDNEFARISGLSESVVPRGMSVVDYIGKTLISDYLSGKIKID